MKILVAIKRVIDYQVKVRVLPDHTGVEKKNVKMSINPFDEIALEEAMRLKEQGVANEVVVVSIGEPACEETLRTALAFGADRAILVTTEQDFYPLNIAKILHALAVKEAPQLVLMGKQAIDNDCNQTPQMLAALLNWPQATFASKIELASNNATVTREIDGGLETINVPLPAVISSDLRLNEPRFISLPNIMKAKSKPLEKLTLQDLNLKLKSCIEVVEVTPPPKRHTGTKVETFAELMAILKDKEKVLP